MGKNKLKKFAKVKDMDHVLEPPFSEVLNKDFRLKGKWKEEFGNDNPIVLELACGKGEYSVGMGERFPRRILSVSISRVHGCLAEPLR